MKKTFWFPLLAAFGAMVFLYLIGFVFDLAILEFKIYQHGTLKK
ncbi:hypothetical protein [Bacillus sp. AK031]